MKLKVGHDKLNFQKNAHEILKKSNGMFVKKNNVPDKELFKIGRFCRNCKEPIEE